MAQRTSLSDWSVDERCFAGGVGQSPLVQPTQRNPHTSESTLPSSDSPTICSTDLRKLRTVSATHQLPLPPPQTPSPKRLTKLLPARKPIQPTRLLDETLDDVHEVRAEDAASASGQPALEG